MNALTQFERGWRCFKEEGPTETFYRLLHRLRLVSVHHALDIYLKEMGEGPEKHLADEGLHLNFREIFPDEIERFRYPEEFRFFDGSSPIQLMQKVFTEKMRFFAALDGDLLIALNGVNTKIANLWSLKKQSLPLPGGTVYLDNAMTAPQYRRRGIGSALRSYMMHLLREEGYRRVILATHPDNKGAARWQESQGFQRWGRIRYLKWRGKDIWKYEWTPLGRREPNLIPNGRFK